MTETDITRAKREFLAFWREHFPEQLTMSREKALVYANDTADGAFNTTRQDQDMIGYQNKVAEVYGAYAAADMQEATIGHILERVRFPQELLVSFGCGPAAFELWLLATGHIQQVVLVDHSPAMLARARAIAEYAGVAERIATDVADVTGHRLKETCADAVFCVNAMHWSRNWRQWIAECAHVAKDNADVFLSCSLRTLRSDIRIPRLEQAVRAKFNIRYQGTLVPPQQIGGMIVQSTRYVVVCRRKRR